MQEPMTASHLYTMQPVEVLYLFKLHHWRLKILIVLSFQSGYEKIVKKLLNKKANVNFKTPNGETPLFAPALYGKSLTLFEAYVK